MSQLLTSGTGGSPVNGIQTINGDTGSITGTNVTIFANIATNNSGGTVSFDNSGTVSTLNLSDALQNTFIGEGSGISSVTGSQNTTVGSFSMTNIAAGNLNTCYGHNAGSFITDGNFNTVIGAQSANLLTTGENNLILGYQNGSLIATGSYNLIAGYAAGSGGDDNSSNIYLTSAGANEDNTIRIGTQGTGNGQQNRCFIAGITGVTVSNTEVVTIDTTTGQLGSQPSVAPAGVNVAAFLATTLSAVTGDNSDFNPIFDSASVNTGTAYNTTTGVFTTPSTGNYLYSIQLSYTGITALNVGSNIRARKNAVIIQNNAINIANIYDPIQTIATVMMTGVAVLTAGDTLDFTAAVGGNATPNANLFGDSVSSTLVITKLP